MRVFTIIYSFITNLLHREFTATTEAPARKARFPLGAYVQEKHRLQKQFIHQKLSKNEEIRQRKEELNVLNKSIHAVEEKIRRKRNRVSIFM